MRVTKFRINQIFIRSLSPSGGGAGGGHFIFILSFFLFAFSFPDDPGESNSYKMDDSEIELYNAWECDCDSDCSFKKIKEGYYAFSSSTHFHDPAKFIVRYFEEFDSLFVYQRYEYSYGVLWSETEGVLYYDTSLTKDFSYDKMVSYGAWNFLPKNESGIYQMKLERKNEGQSVNAPEPFIHHKLADDLLLSKRLEGASNPEETMKFLRENKGLGLFVHGIEIRMKIYHKGKIIRRTFYFRFRHGEC